MVRRLFPVMLMSGALLRAQNRVTILYDAFGKDAAMKQDWGYSVFMEYNGKRILFDTGNDPAVLEQNAKAAKIDLGRLDFVVISHRHTDHTMGIGYLTKVDPSVKIYGAIRLCRRKCSITAEKSRNASPTVAPGRKRTSNSLPKTPRWFRGFGSCPLPPKIPARKKCARTPWP